MHPINAMFIYTSILRYVPDFRGIAASAPVLQFEGITNCNAFSQIVTKDFEKASPNCSSLIRKSWDVINKFGKSGMHFKMRFSIGPYIESVNGKPFYRSGTRMVNKYMETLQPFENLPRH